MLDPSEQVTAALPTIAELVAAFFSALQIEGLVQNYCNYLILYKELQ